MIAGVGMDIVDIELFREQLDDRASSFVEGTFTVREQDDAKNRPGRDLARHLAARFAAKEALIKAWSTALWGKPPILQTTDMREIEVCLDPFGRPSLELHGAVKQGLAEFEPYRCHLSLTHDGRFAAAVAVLEVDSV